MRSRSENEGLGARQRRDRRRGGGSCAGLERFRKKIDKKRLLPAAGPG